jgi:hypothetical protein
VTAAGVAEMGKAEPRQVDTVVVQTAPPLPSSHLEGWAACSRTLLRDPSARRRPCCRSQARLGCNRGACCHSA